MLGLSLLFCEMGTFGVGGVSDVLVYLSGITNYHKLRGEPNTHTCAQSFVDQKFR